MVASPQILDTNKIVATILQVLENAWNNADGAAFSEPFVIEADHVDSKGYYHQSKIGIAKSHQNIFDSEFRSSTARYSLIQSRQVDKNIIIAHAEKILTVPSGSMEGTHTATLSFVIARRDTVWLIESMHSTVSITK